MVDTQVCRRHTCVFHQRLIYLWNVVDDNACVLATHVVRSINVKLKWLKQLASHGTHSLHCSSAPTLGSLMLGTAELAAAN